MTIRFLFIFFICSSTILAQDSLVLHFKIGSCILSPQEKKKVMDCLKIDVKEIKRINGFTDSLGSMEKNIPLSSARAFAVKSFLDSIFPELSKNAIANGFGECPTLGPSNRKVVIFYTKTLSSSIKKLKPGDKITLLDVNFEPGSEIYMPGTQAIISELLHVLQANPNLKIGIEGHICCELNDETNLSTRRALAIYNDLISQGIDGKRLTFNGFGATQPKWPIPEKNEQERKENRRVEIRIL